MTYKPYNVIIQEAAQTGSSAQIIELTNNSGSPIANLQPVSVDASGDIKGTDVSIENDAIKFLGLASQNIPNGSSGNVVISGRIANISTTLSFGSYVYVSKSGGLTDILPTEGVNGFVAGDYVIRVGVIARNQDNPLNKDIIIYPALIGQL
jgi:hypothetical protein